MSKGFDAVRAKIEEAECWQLSDQREIEGLQDEVAALKAALAEKRARIRAEEVAPLLEILREVLRWIGPPEHPIEPKIRAAIAAAEERAQ